MSESGNKLIGHIKRIAKHDGEVLAGKVKEVDGESCTVEVDGLEFYNVRMQARVQAGQKGFRIKPKIGSSVLIEKMDGNGDSEYFVTMYSEFESVTADVNGVRLFIDENGFTLKKGTVNLVDVIDDFMGQVKALNEELQKVVVVIGVTPNVAALQGINAQLEINRSKAKDLLK
jgi:hypothetical protein